jgi:soluble lytic murein transglycosylase-like protein
VLSERDISRYRVVFELQEDGAWTKADEIIADLQDRTLMGHVLAQRYLHPTKYRSKYAELRDWLAEYHDHPDAARLYKLALKRKPKNLRSPHPPSTSFLTGSGHDGTPAGTLQRPPKKPLSGADLALRKKLDRQFAWYLRKGWTKSLKGMLNDKNYVRLHSATEYDRRKGQLGFAYFADGHDEWALDWAGSAAQRSGKYFPQAHWAAGMAAWRLGKFERALDHFAAVARNDYSSPWLITAGAFWAARSVLRVGKPQAYNDWLGIAAAYPRTFYGLLARRALGLEVTFNWNPPPLGRDQLAALTAHPGGRRAFSLLQLGDDERAERELRYLYGDASDEIAPAMLALADRAEMPALAMRLGNLLSEHGSSLYDSTAYPVPKLTARNGISIDKALVLAFIRQESGFNPNARSHAGARGLMQLMPRTASFVERDRRYRQAGAKALFNPETNIEIGQKYIDMLRADAKVGNDLFMIVAAWNGGPGNLNKWRRTLKYNDDPLLFIETIPLRETRIFIERVLTNLWIYRARLGQPTPSLDAAAAGDWPVYEPMHARPLEFAEDGQKEEN